MRSLPILAAWTICALVQPAASQRYAREIQAWVQQDALRPPPSDAVLFIGSSSIRRWEELAHTFADYDVIQRGFGGAQLTDLKAYVGQIVLPYDPAAIVVFAGTNDVAAGRTAQIVFADYGQFVQMVHAGQDPARPPIPIFYIGITPTPARWGLWPVASAANALIAQQAAADPALHYIDVPGPFLATGQPPTVSLFVADALHLSPSGYDLFGTTIRQAVSAHIRAARTPRPNPLHPSIGERLLLDLGPDNPADGRHTSSPDPNGNHWNNWHSVDGGLGILAGQTLANLRTSGGTPTGIDLIITGGFSCNGILNGGLLDPDPGLLGTFAIPTATEDYFFATGDDSPGGLQLTGLDPFATYTLRCFATRNTTEVRRTGYRVLAESRVAAGTLQTSGAGAGSGGATGNDDDVAVLDELRPDRFGQLFVDVQRLAGTFAYLGIVELEVRDRMTDLGPGCPGNGATLRMDHPSVGLSTWTLQTDDLPPTAVGAVLLSFGAPSATPVPFGCTAHVDLNPANQLTVLPILTDASGTWSGQRAIPALPTLTGATITLQAGAIASPAGPFDLTNGLRATIR